MIICVVRNEFVVVSSDLTSGDPIKLTTSGAFYAMRNSSGFCLTIRQFVILLNLDCSK